MNVRCICGIAVLSFFMFFVGSDLWYRSQASLTPRIVYPEIKEAALDETTDGVKIQLGRELFLHQWSVQDDLAGEGDGLGPVCNANSCAACHFKGGVGGAGDVEEVMSQLRLNTPALFGAGLIDQIPASAIRLSSIPQLVDQTKPVGRFGWKGQFATLRAFVGTAAAVELGLTNDFEYQSLPGRWLVDREAKSDLTSKQLEAMVAFCASLPRPRQVMPKLKSERDSVLRGEKLFESFGCAKCHVPNLGGLNGVYSDFKLHDLTDVKKHDDWESPYRTHKEWSSWDGWKTPALWGVADSAPYMHDGRAKTLRQAISRHGNAASQSRQHYRDAKASKKTDLINFLRSLRAPKLAEACPTKLRGKVHIAPGGLMCY